MHVAFAQRVFHVCGQVVVANQQTAVSGQLGAVHQPAHGTNHGHAIHHAVTALGALATAGGKHFGRQGGAGGQLCRIDLQAIHAQQAAAQPGDDGI